MEKVEIPLTAQQIEQIDSNAAETRAVELTLEKVLQFHANRQEELTEWTRKWWEDFADTHGLDLQKSCYKVKKINGRMCVVYVGPCIENNKT
ncbi:MAG: hypothetical protein KAJ19_03850 [Gammaproteobacteria bacterium]|nr:hypothetical protein [Gammaproteobacteria bacterium]